MDRIIRFIIVYINYLRIKIKYRGHIRFKGFAVIYRDKKSCICFSKSGCSRVFSHSLSNLIGISQRCILVARNGGKINIGANVGISGSTIYSVDSIIIGENTNIGSGCKIIDTDFHPLSYSHRYPRELKDKIRHRPIVIGEGCFIGANSIILKGTILGKNVVVGAGSVVSGTFPDNVIIAGNPAKIIKENKE